jgi:hypothetical protein
MQMPMKPGMGIDKVSNRYRATVVVESRTVQRRTVPKSDGPGSQLGNSSDLFMARDLL